jgi:hypothetical protein
MSSQAGAASRSPTHGRQTIREPSLLAAASIRWCVGGPPLQVRAASRGTGRRGRRRFGVDRPSGARRASGGALIRVLAWHGPQET